MAKSYEYAEERTLNITDSAATTAVIDMSDVDGGHFQIVSGGVVTLTWQASVDGVTYKPAVDSTGTPVTQTVNTTDDFPIPSTLNGRRFVRAVAAGGTSGVMAVGLKRISMS